jgi:cholesterol transport system auxiliary component
MTSPPVRRRPRPTALLGLAAVAVLGACVTVFPKEKPVQMYRFEDIAAPVAASPADRFTVRASVSGFDPAAASDRILSATGDDTAYIAQARWVSPAISLFDTAVDRAFQAHGGPATLLAPGEVAAPDQRLFLDVETFEVRFDQARGAPPHVAIVVRAALEDTRKPAARSERLFRADVTADADAMSAIVTAFDRAVTNVLGQVVDWVDQRPGA